MNISVKELENLEVGFTIDQHDMKGKCIESCILLNISEKVILKFKTLNELKGLIDHSNDIIKFDGNEESETFKEKLKNVVRKIQMKYDLREDEDF